jgi:molybdate transport system substrate-binding protein
MIPPAKTGEAGVATIKVMATGAVESMVRLLGAEYEKATGNTLDLNFGTAGTIRGRFDGGEATDIVVLPAAVIEAMEQAGRFVPGSVIDLGRTVTGVVVKEGATPPDISTPEAFKQALLKAKGVSFSDPKAGGSSGNYFAGLLQKLGIAEAVNKKAVLGKRGYEVAYAVADGRAEIGSTFISEMLPVKGVQVVGPLPGELYFANTYTAAIPAGSAQRDGALALLRVLTDSATRDRWTAAGLEPAFPAG